MGLNTIKVSCSIAILVIIGCLNKGKNKQDSNIEPKEDCRYILPNGRRIVSDLGCTNCHSSFYERLAPHIPSLADVTEMDSLKLYKFAFKEKHKGWYSKNADFKDSKMDTLSECEIKSAIRFLKDAGRGIIIAN